MASNAKYNRSQMCIECRSQPRLKGRSRCRDCHNKRQRELRLDRMGVSDNPIERLCACGCGNLVTTYHGRDGRVLNQYIYGHLENVLGTTQKCECGCGETIDAFSSDGRRRHYRKGHYNRPPKMTKDEVRAARKIQSRASNQRLRLLVLAAYGDACACCSETESLFLTIDHTERNGASERKAKGYATGASFYRWLFNQGCPQSGFQCLCWNCNSGRELNDGVCPHQTF